METTFEVQLKNGSCVLAIKEGQYQQKIGRAFMNVDWDEKSFINTARSEGSFRDSEGNQYPFEQIEKVKKLKR